MSKYLMPHLEGFLGMSCPYCYDTMSRVYMKMPTREHIIPRAKGGRLDNGNKTVVCRECNELKADRDIVEFYDWLKTRKDVRSEWRVYCIQEFYCRWERTKRTKKLISGQIFVPDYVDY